MSIVHDPSVSNRLHDYASQMRKATDWELELELMAQAEARKNTRLLLEETNRDTDEHRLYACDLLLIIHYISIVSAEITKRYIP